jgi:hypothetical protein
MGSGLLSDNSAELKVRLSSLVRLSMIPKDYYQPHLEVQTELIVYAIQSVLSSLRAPTPLPSLNANLAQIITIVSSIVVVYNYNLSPASTQQGKGDLERDERACE